MIAVIADDFTGAAEIGGVGLKYGLRVVIQTRINGAENTDLLVIAAKTRSLSEEGASTEIENITSKLKEHKPEYIFKKLDSVLRGNIASELISQLEVSGKERAIMVAGNPSFGRVIENGNYTVNGVPLAKTSFANDPDFPVHSSMVTDIIQSDKIDIYSLPVESEIPENGLIIGDVKNHEEMLAWVDKIKENTVVAGGAGFFDVLMSKRFAVVQPECQECLKLGDTVLIVLGSKFPKTGSMPLGLSEKNAVKLNMPDTIYTNMDKEDQALRKWAQQVVVNLKEKMRVVVTVEQDFSEEENISVRIRESIGNLLKLVVEQIQLSDLLIEGGATTSEILETLNIEKLYPNRLVGPGIIQMETEGYSGMTITTKPGSYPWPELEAEKNNITVSNNL